VLVGIGSVAALGALVAGMWSTAAGSDGQEENVAPAVEPADDGQGDDLQTQPGEGWSMPDEGLQDPSGSPEGFDDGAIPSAPEIQPPSGPPSSGSHAS
jgi:hypothetical protein